MKLQQFDTGTHNQHPAPPRLLPLVAYARGLMASGATPAGDPGHDASGDEPFAHVRMPDAVRDALRRVVTCPPHVTTGSLRRGWLDGCVARVVDWESRAVRERSAAARRMLEMRPDSVAEGEWSEWLASLLLSGRTLAEIEGEAAERAAVLNAQAAVREGHPPAVAREADVGAWDAERAEALP